MHLVTGYETERPVKTRSVDIRKLSNDKRNTKNAGKADKDRHKHASVSSDEKHKSATKKNYETDVDHKRPKTRSNRSRMAASNLAELNSEVLTQN